MRLEIEEYVCVCVCVYRQGFCLRWNKVKKRFIKDVCVRRGWLIGVAEYESGNRNKWYFMLYYLFHLRARYN